MNLLNISQDIFSLTAFKRNTPEFLKKMKRNRRPMVLTVKGKAEMVALDVASFQEMLEALDRAEAIEGIRRGLEDVKHGRTKPAKQFLEELRREFNFPKRQ